MRAAIVRTCLLVWTCTTVGAACSGTPFCEDSRTCEPSAAGAAGDASSAGVESQPSGGGADGTPAGGASMTGDGVGAAGAVSEDGNAGAGGTGAIEPVGMPCEADEECDDQDSCTGVEACVDGICQAGEAVECPVGMECSAEQDDACVFSSEAPWIVYRGGIEYGALLDAFAIKADLLGQMEPVKLNPEIEDCEQVFDIGYWSPGGSTAVVTVDHCDGYLQAYAVHFGDKLPEAAVHLTEGMSVSQSNFVRWSPSGKTLLISRDDGLHAVDYVPGQPVVESRVSEPGFTALDGTFKSDDELVWVGRSTATGKSRISRAVRQGETWVQDPLVSDVLMIWGGPVPGGALAFYVAQEQSQLSLFQLETVSGAQPLKIAGPAYQLAPAGSPDFTYLMVATSASAAKNSTIFAGELASAAALPILKQNVALYPTDILQNINPFAPDASLAALFQAGTFGRQLVLSNPRGGANKWTPIAAEQASASDGAVLWSPDSKLVALPTRTSATSAFKLSLVDASDHQKRDLDTIAEEDLLWSRAQFSPEGEFFFYMYGYSTWGHGAYVDLRDGLAAATVHDVGDALTGWSLPSKGTDLVYVQTNVDSKFDCFHLELSGEGVAEPVKVNGDGYAISCSFQPLP